MSPLPVTTADVVLRKVEPVQAPVRSQAAQSLREAIFTGRLAPGAKLVETTLCELLDVSRPSIREAMRQLEAEKLVTIIPFRGPFVARMTVDSARQLYEVRAILEAQAAATAAKLATPDDLKEMAAALAEFAVAVRSKDAFARLRHTDQFYAAVFRAAGNVVLVEVLEGLQARINYLRYRSMSSPDRAESSLQEMNDILKAIRARSGDRAARAARLHVERARDTAITMMESK